MPRQARSCSRGPARPPAADRPPGLHALPRLAIALLALTLAAGLALARLDPQQLADWGQEDGPIETLTAAVFALAALRAACCLPRQRPLPPMIVPLGGFALVCALDELSWGERLFGLRMPQLGGVQIDAVHDLVDLVLGVGGRHPWAMLAVLTPLLLIVARTWRAQRVRVLAGWRRLGGSAAGPACQPLLIWMSLLLGVAVTIDATHPAQAAWQTLEEALELHAGLAVLLAVWVLGRQGPVAGQADGPRDPAD
ncbi:MAG: hypothetical protein RL223_356 [Pseudomonadota bacterium]|jgi:hypothetical protein